MQNSRKSHFRLFLFLGILALLAVAGYAFAANNTVAASNAGDGSEVISGYTITNVSYDLDTTDPALIDGVSFSIAPVVAKTVRIQLVDGGQWFDCKNAGGLVSCDIAIAFIEQKS